MVNLYTVNKIELSNKILLESHSQYKDLIVIIKTLYNYHSSS